MSTPTRPHHVHSAGEHDLRGPLLAAASTALAVGIYVLVTRFGEDWSAAVEFLVTAVPAAAVLVLALREGAVARERDARDGAHDARGDDGALGLLRARPWVSAMLGAAFALAVGALASLAEVLGASEDELASGTLTWITAVLALGWAFLAVTRRSGLCALLAAVSAVVCANALVDWVADPDGTSTFRWVLLGCIVALLGGVVVLRERALHHATALADVAGLAAIAIAVTFALEGFVGAFLGEGEGTGTPDPAWGWDLVVLLTAAALTAFALRHRVAGPGWIAAVALLAFVLMNSDTDDPSVLGWPLLLLVVAAGLAALALRPRRAAPGAAATEPGAG